jgi:hypothetical protein
MNEISYKPKQIEFEFHSEADEISPEDLQAAAEKYDDVKANPTKYFTKPTDMEKIISVIKKSAQSLINQSEKINTEVSVAWTRKRQSQADQNLKKKDRLVEWAIVLNTLALLWIKNEVPEILVHIRSGADLKHILWKGYPIPLDEDHPIGGWYREEYPALKKKSDRLGITSKEVCQEMRNLIKTLGTVNETPEQIKERELKKLLAEIRSANIPGFYPTPDDLIDKMLDYANIDEYHSILEPSAGIGSILDRIVSKRTNPSPMMGIDCCELNYTLANILMKKGYCVKSNDIYNMIYNHGYDRIIMNPPFEYGEDIEQVMFCFKKHLKYGGRLVSIMSAGVKSNTKSKYIYFRNWVEENNGYFIDNGQAFKETFNSTGVSSVTLIIDKL